MIASEKMIAPEKGFTLMEILVSLAVLSIVLVSVFKLQSSTIALAEAAHFKLIAPILARQQLSALEKAGLDPDELPREFEGEFQGYTLTCEVENGTDAADLEDILSGKPAEQLKKIRLTIYSPGEERRFSIETWRFVNDE